MFPDAARLAALEAPRFSDEQLRDSIESGQLRIQQERGVDLTLFSPRAAGMSHHIGDAATSLSWSMLCNDLIARICRMHPRHFVGVAQLPQSPGVAPANCIPELVRCVEELGFIGCNLNPGAHKVMYEPRTAAARHGPRSRVSAAAATTPARSPTLTCLRTRS